MTYPQHDAEHDAGLAWNPDDLEALESLRSYRAPRDLDNLGLPPRARQEPRDTRAQLDTLRTAAMAAALDLERLGTLHIIDTPQAIATRLRAAIEASS